MPSEPSAESVEPRDGATVPTAGEGGIEWCSDQPNAQNEGEAESWTRLQNSGARGLHQHRQDARAGPSGARELPDQAGPCLGQEAKWAIRGSTDSALKCRQAWRRRDPDLELKPNSIQVLQALPQR